MNRNAENFLENVSKMVAKFLDEQLFDKPRLSLFQSQSIGLGLHGTTREGTRLVLVKVGTTARENESSLIEREVEEDGVSYVVEVRPPWCYSLTYGLFGVALHEPQGMRLSSRMHRLLFDSPRLSEETLKRFNLEQLETVRLMPAEVEVAQLPQATQQSVQSMPLCCALRVEFNYATETPLSRLKKVQKRALHVGMQKEQ